MDFKMPFPSNSGRRGRRSWAPRASRGAGGKYEPNPVATVPFITFNKTRSRSRSRKRPYSFVNLNTNFDMESRNLLGTTDTEDQNSSEDEMLSTKKGESHKHKNLNKNNESQPSTSNNYELKAKILTPEIITKNNEEINESFDNNMIESTYSRAVTKGLDPINNAQGDNQNKIYKDTRASIFLQKAVWFTRNRDTDARTYIEAIREVTGKDSITDFQVIPPNKIEIYMRTEDQATKLALEGVKFGNKKLRIFHMVKHPIKLYISGVKPWIADGELIHALKNIGYTEERELKRLTYSTDTQETSIRYGVRVINICRRPEGSLPKSVNLHVNGDIHTIYLTPEFITCYNCDQPGHISKNCMEMKKNNNNAANEYRTNFPEIKTIRPPSVINEDMRINKDIRKETKVEKQTRQITLSEKENQIIDNDENISKNDEKLEAIEALEDANSDNRSTHVNQETVSMDLCTKMLFDKEMDLIENYQTEKEKTENNVLKSNIDTLDQNDGLIIEKEKEKQDARNTFVFDEQSQLTKIEDKKSTNQENDFDKEKSPNKNNSGDRNRKKKKPRLSQNEDSKEEEEEIDDPTSHLKGKENLNNKIDEADQEKQQIPHSSKKVEENKTDENLEDEQMDIEYKLDTFSNDNLKLLENLIKKKTQRSVMIL